MDVLKHEYKFEIHKRRDKVKSKLAYSTSQTEGSAFDGIHKAKRWRLKEEIIKLFAESLKRSFPDLKEDANPVVSASLQRGHGDYNCRNALRIWAKIRKSSHLIQKYSHIRGPSDVGEVIKNNLPKSDMIMEHKWTPSVHDAGFVIITLSRKWMVESIHKMLKEGIDTWAPKLPVERVIVDYPSWDEEMHVDLFQRMAIGQTLSRMLEYSKASVSIGYALRGCIELSDDHDINLNENKEQEQVHFSRNSAEHILNRWFSIIERSGDVVISGKGKLPFILAKRDFDNAHIDLEKLRYMFEEENADWLIYLTPVQLHEYIEMCFSAAKLEGWIPIDRHKPLRTSYVGYRTWSKPDKFVSLLKKVKSGCQAVAEGDDAKLLGYTTEAVLDCVLMYTYLKNHRLAEGQFSINDDMLNKEGNTFVYLLNIRAKIRRITDDSRKDINEIKTASEFILERNKGWGKSAERALEFHLLGFTDALEQACLFVLPHIVCEYLYSLSKKFTSYYSSMRKIGSIAEMSTLLLCEATEVVMDKCFHLLGITPEVTKSFERLRVDMNAAVAVENRMSAKRKQKEAKRKLARLLVDVNAAVAIENRTSAKRKQKEAKRKLERFFNDLFIARPVSVDRGPSRNSRFELFSVIPSVTTDPKFEFEEGKLFGLIAVSDKHGLLPVGESHTSEPDAAYVSLFKVDWCDAIDIRESGILFLGNPSSRRSVSFSSSIGIWMELNVTTEREDRCFEICNCKFELDTSDIWEEEIDGKCGCFSVEGEDGSTQMHYILLKDAVDTDLEVRFNTKTARQVRGRIYAYYGSDFPYGRRPMHASYVALLFESDLPVVLEDGEIKLKRTMLAVPLNGSLIINVKLVDVDSEEVLFQDSRTFKSQPKDSSHETIEGTDCSLDLKVHWNYQSLISNYLYYVIRL